jgi:hypothetical protein
MFPEWSNFETRCLKIMLMLMQFIQYVMSFSICYEFSFRIRSVKLKEDEVQAY